MQVSTPLCGILIFYARQLARCACWRAVHLRGVHTFRSIETEFANFFFSFRDSDSPSPPKISGTVPNITLDGTAEYQTDSDSGSDDDDPADGQLSD